MPPSLRALLDGLIDYAGLFPPAALAMDDAAARYARYRSGPDAWMLGRFIAPAARLDGLDPHVGRFVGTPLRVSVIAPAADAPSGAPDAVRAGVAGGRAFEARHPGRVLADRFEVRVPAGMDGAALADLLEGAAETARRPEGDADVFFYEVPLSGQGWRVGIERAAAAVAEHNVKAGRAEAGVKLRLGGETPEAFPSVATVAAALVALREAGAPFKATAGLHHPVRRPAPDVPGAVMHGFVNVFGAAALAHARKLDGAAIGRVLAEERLERFVFDEDGLAWNGYGCTAREVAAARASFCTTYGSCSFDEPREDLRAAGMLPVNGRR